MSYNYQTKEILNIRGPSPDAMKFDAGATFYTQEQFITHLDSLHGIWVRIVGERGGADVTVQLQESMAGGKDAKWTDVGASYLFGAGGIYGGVLAAADVEHFFAPAAGVTFKPHLRLKITTAAATEVYITRVQWSTRGLK